MGNVESGPGVDPNVAIGVKSDRSYVPGIGAYVTGGDSAWNPLNWRMPSKEIGYRSAQMGIQAAALPFAGLSAVVGGPYGLALDAAVGYGSVLSDAALDVGFYGPKYGAENFPMNVATNVAGLGFGGIVSRPVVKGVGKVVGPELGQAAKVVGRGVAREVRPIVKGTGVFPEYAGSAGRWRQLGEIRDFLGDAGNFNDVEGFTEDLHARWLHKTQRRGPLIHWPGEGRKWPGPGNSMLIPIARDRYNASGMFHDVGQTVENSFEGIQNNDEAFTNYSLGLARGYGVGSRRGRHALVNGVLVGGKRLIEKRLGRTLYPRGLRRGGGVLRRPWRQVYKSDFEDFVRKNGGVGGSQEMSELSAPLFGEEVSELPHSYVGKDVAVYSSSAVERALLSSSNGSDEGVFSNFADIPRHRKSFAVSDNGVELAEIPSSSGEELKDFGVEGPRDIGMYKAVNVYGGDDFGTPLLVPEGGGAGGGYSEPTWGDFVYNWAKRLRLVKEVRPKRGWENV